MTPNTATLYEAFGELIEHAVPQDLRDPYRQKSASYSLRFETVDAVSKTISGGHYEDAMDHLATMNPERRAMLEREWKD